MWQWRRGGGGGAGAAHLLVQLEVVGDLLKRVCELLGMLVHLRVEATGIDLDLLRRCQRRGAGDGEEGESRESHVCRACCMRVCMVSCAVFARSHLGALRVQPRDPLGNVWGRVAKLQLVSAAFARPLIDRPPLAARLYCLLIVSS